MTEGEVIFAWLAIGPLVVFSVVGAIVGAYIGGRNYDERSACMPFGEEVALTAFLGTAIGAIVGCIWPLWPVLLAVWLIAKIAARPKTNDVKAMDEKTRDEQRAQIPYRPTGHDEPV